MTLEIKTQKRDKTTRGEQEKRAKISKLLMQNQQNLSPKRAREQENLKCKGRGEERREAVELISGSETEEKNGESN